MARFFFGEAKDFTAWAAVIQHKYRLRLGLGRSEAWGEGRGARATRGGGRCAECERPIAAI